VTMGFTTGLLGGFTLTTTILYLSLSLHARNREHQASLLHQQAFILNQLVEPQPPAPPPIPREVQAGVWETAKDRWNKELEDNVRKLYQIDWDRVRENTEEGVSALWRRAFERGRQGLEQVQEKSQGK